METIHDLILSKQEELTSIQELNLSKLKKWHISCRALISEHYVNQIELFDSHIKTQPTSNNFPLLPRGPSKKTIALLKNDERRKANLSKEKILIHLNAILELPLQELPQSEPNELPQTESNRMFETINSLISNSNITLEWKQITTSDLAEAEKCYTSSVFKGCVVMLGAVLEGVMLGSLQRNDVIQHLKDNSTSAPTRIQNIGINNPTTDLANEIANSLSFEDFKVSINHLVPNSNEIGVEDIQSFRNAIHPWKCLKDPTKYTFDQTRAIVHISSLEKIVEILTSWSPL